LIPRQGAVADALSIVALHEELKTMAAAAIHVVPDDSFEDWVVRDDNGDEFGHYATREAAELVAPDDRAKSAAMSSSFTSPTEE